MSRAARRPRLASLLLLGAATARAAGDGGLLECASSAATEAAGLACVAAARLSSAGAGSGDDVAAVRAAVEALMDAGLFNATAALVQRAQEAGAVSQAELSTTVFQASSRVSRRLQGLQDLVSARAAAAGIPPAYEWAQSPDAVFLQVKFAHKLDTPATLGCEAEAPVCRNDSVTLRAECREKKKTFLLSVTPFAALDPAGCTGAMAAAGRFQLTLKKAAPALWSRLLQAAEVKPKNLHVWFSMKEAHEETNAAWERQRKAREKEERDKEAAAAAAADGGAGGAESADGGGEGAAAAPSAEGGGDAQAADDAAADGAAADGGDAAAPPPSPSPSASPSDSPSPSATPSATPLPTAEDGEVAADRVRAAMLADLSSSEAAELKKIDERRREARAAVDTRARADRAAADAEAQAARAETTARFEERRRAVAETHAAQVESARQLKSAMASAPAEL